jgi:hypothetical protein
MVSVYMTSNFSVLKVTLHPALHRILMPIRDAIVIPGMICPVNIVERPGMVMSHMWVETTLLPLSKVMVIGWSARHKLLTGVPFIINIEVTPLSKMARVVVIVLELAHSKHRNGVEQFDAMTVALLSLIDGSADKESKCR